MSHYRPRSRFLTRRFQALSFWLIMNGLKIWRWSDSPPRWATLVALVTGILVLTGGAAALYRGLTYREPLSE